MEISFQDMLRLFGAVSGIVLFLLTAMWMMFQRPRVQAMLNKQEDNMIKRLDDKYGYEKGEMFAKKEKTALKLNDLSHEQGGDRREFKDIKRRIEKLENGKGK